MEMLARGGEAFGPGWAPEIIRVWPEKVRGRNLQLIAARDVQVEHLFQHLETGLPG